MGDPADWSHITKPLPTPEDELNFIRAGRAEVEAELFDAQHLISILLSRLGGFVVLTEAEIVASPRAGVVERYRNDVNGSVIVRWKAE